MSGAKVDIQQALARAKAIANKLSSQVASAPADSSGPANDDDLPSQAEAFSQFKRQGAVSYGAPTPAGGMATAGGAGGSYSNVYNLYGASDMEEVNVPTGLVGLIIGRGGETLRGIESATGVKVLIAKEHETKEGYRPISLTGPRAGIDHAKRIINRKVEEGMGKPAFGPLSGTADQPVVEVRIPVDKVGLIIGRQATTLKAIQEKTNAKVYVTPTHRSDPNDPERSVMIQGTEVAVNMARSLIEAVVRNGPAALNQFNGGSTLSSANFDPNMQTIRVEVPNEAIGLLIGKGGDTIKTIAQVSQCRVTVEKTDRIGATRALLVQGEPTWIKYAKQLIRERVEASKTSRSRNKPYEPPPFDPYEDYNELAQQQGETKQEEFYYDPNAAEEYAKYYNMGPDLPGTYDASAYAAFYAQAAAFYDQNNGGVVSPTAVSFDHVSQPMQQPSQPLQQQPPPMQQHHGRMEGGVSEQPPNTDPNSPEYQEWYRKYYEQYYSQYYQQQQQQPPASSAAPGRDEVSAQPPNMDPNSPEYQEWYRKYYEQYYSQYYQQQQQQHQPQQ